MLRVAIISDNMQRADRVLHSVYEKEIDRSIKLSRRKRQAITENIVYKIFSPDERKLKGLRADQIILSTYLQYRLEDAINSILVESCVPKKYQIIDDRTVLI